MPTLFHTQPAVTTVPGVEIVRVGTWNASTGPTRVTEEHLQAMVAAAGDTEVDLAMIKPGHIDPRWDGQPAMGAVRNLRVEARSPGPGAPAVPTLVGDLVNVPSALAEVMPLAWPNRSAEISWGVVTSRGRYAAALTGLALLGVTPPAVKGLAQVSALYSGVPTPPRAEAFTALAFTNGEPSPVAAGDGLAGVGLGLWVPLASPDAPIRDSGGAAGENVAMPMTDERLRQLIGCAAEANLEAEVAALVARAGAAPPAPPTPPAAAPPAPTASAGSPPPAVATPPAAATAPAAATPPAPATVPGTQAQPAAGPPAPAPAAPVAPAGATAPMPPLPDGMVLISQGVLDQLTRDSAAGAAAAATLQEADNERVLTAALSEGRIAPADLADRAGPNGATIPGLRSAIRSNPTAVRTMLAALTPRFSTSAVGADTGVEVETQGSPAEDAAWAAFEAHLGANFGVAAQAQPGQPAAGQPGGAA